MSEQDVLNKICSAILENKEKLIEETVRGGYDANKIINKWNPSGPVADLVKFRKWTILMLAVYHDCENIVKILISRGADPNKTGNDGNTPLIINIENNKSLAIGKYLLNKGANTCKPDEKGRTPLSWAVLKKNIKMINTLLDHGAEMTIHTALLEAIASDDVVIVKLLKKRGADINLVYPDTGTTPLMKALTLKHGKVAKFLIENGADVHLKGKDGKSPIEECFEMGNLALAVKIITKKNINVNKDYQDKLFVKSLRMQNLPLVKYFVKKEVDINQKDETGKTPLEIALSNSDLPTVKFLIDAGAERKSVNSLIQERVKKDVNFAIYMESLKITQPEMKDSITEETKDVAPGTAQ
jgi:ankyrin repeat protein